MNIKVPFPNQLSKFNVFQACVVERDSRVTVIAKKGRHQFRAHLRNTGGLNQLIYPGGQIICTTKEGGVTKARVLGAVANEAAALLDTFVQAEMFEKPQERTYLIGFLRRECWLKRFQLKVKG